jgi:Ca2+-transporting ATPase
MLWINLIMDTFAALALATESPTDKQILRAPISRSEPIVDAVMWRDIFGQSIY